MPTMYDDNAKPITPITLLALYCCQRFRSCALLPARQRTPVSSLQSLLEPCKHGARMSSDSLYAFVNPASAAQV